MDANTAIAIIAGALVVLFVARNFIGKVSPQAAKELVEGGATLLDVRTAPEYAAGHIDGAINVPVQELSGRVSELSGKSDPIVVYCLSGARSAQGKRVLKSKGFTEVHDLGSIRRWR